MFCDSCGNAIHPGQNHCPQCGKAVFARPVPSSSARVARHRQSLGILWIVYAVFSLVQSVALFILANAYTHVGRLLRPDVGLPSLPHFLQPLASFVAMLLLAKAVVGIIAGVGLLQWQSWARGLMLVVAFVSLLSLPIGTALGIYTLWVLFAPKTGEEYRAMSKAAGA